MNILIIDDKVPDPNFGAGFPRAYRLMLSLIEMGHTIHFVPLLKDCIQNLDIDLLASYNTHVYDDLDKVKSVDVAIISRPHNMHLSLQRVKQKFPNIKTIYDTEALWFRRYDLQKKITGRLPSWAYYYDEVGFARQVDVCWVVNDEEKQILESSGVKKVIKLAHALDPVYEGLSFQERKDFLVVGGKLEEDSSNEDALWWFLENCWDEVRLQNKAKLDVAGLPTAPRLLNHPFKDVNLMNYVPDLSDLYKSHRVFVATTRFATGIPWKVHEAMANGIPCVVSPLLAHQLQVTDGKEVLVAKDKVSGIDACKRLYNDVVLWTKIREEGHTLIQRECCPDDYKKIIEATLGSLVS